MAAPCSKLALNQGVASGCPLAKFVLVEASIAFAAEWAASSSDEADWFTRRSEGLLSTIRLIGFDLYAPPPQLT